MSSILDALKKSEADRQRAAGPTLLDLRVQPRKRGLPAWAIALGVLLVGNGALLAWLTLRHPPAATAPAAAAPASTAATPAAQPAPTATQAVTPATTPAATPAATASVRQPVANDAEGNPADEVPAVEATPRQHRAGTAGLQSYSALSATLPPLHLDLHFWSEAPAERYALINLHRVGEGDALPEGPRVLEITRDGVVMEYEGREFVLGRE